MITLFSVSDDSSNQPSSEQWLLKRVTLQHPSNNYRLSIAMWNRFRPLVTKISGTAAIKMKMLENKIAGIAVKNPSRTALNNYYVRFFKMVSLFDLFNDSIHSVLLLSLILSVQYNKVLNQNLSAIKWSLNDPAHG